MEYRGGCPAFLYVSPAEWLAIKRTYPPISADDAAALGGFGSGIARFLFSIHIVVEPGRRSSFGRSWLERKAHRTFGGR